MSTKCNGPIVCESWFEQVNHWISFSIDLTFIEGIVLNTWHLSLHSHNHPTICVLLMFPYYPWEFRLSRFTRAAGGGGDPQVSRFCVNHKLCFSIYCTSATFHWSMLQSIAKAGPPPSPRHFPVASLPHHQSWQGLNMPQRQNNRIFLRQWEKLNTG